MKTVDEIYGELLASFGKRTGLEPREGCDLSARMYALAAQVCALYVQADWVLRQAFPQTAEGDYLDAHAQLRGLARKRATAAQGMVRFTAGEKADAPREIPKGTVCMTAGLVRFETERAGVLEAGALTADVPVRALEAGEAGNVSAGAISSMAVAPMGIASCTNPQPCGGGSDGEEDEVLRERVLGTFKRLPNGANAAYYEQVALSRTGVAAAVAVGRPRGVGSVDLYIATDAGLPDRALLDEVGAYLQEKREISVDLRVLAPTAKAVNISVAIQPAGGFTFDQARSDADAALRAAFTGAMLGREVTLAFLGNLLYELESVQNYRFTRPSADMAASPTVLPCLGSVTISDWGN